MSKTIALTTFIPVDSGKKFEVEHLHSNYEVTEDKDSYWVFHNNKNQYLPLQGWKIHISANLSNAKQTLDVLSPILVDNNVSFKHLKDQRTLYEANSKNAPRESSGKFITIYPKNDEQFLLLINNISEVLNDFSKGPYILSDKRWKNSNVYYRYGGFQRLYNSNGELCVKSPTGELIKDERTPYYHVPDFKKDFDLYLDSLNITKKSDENNKLNDYIIKEALSFSNSGGVYLAERKKDRLKVIIKEARPNTGYDGQYRTSFDRQEIEYRALNDLTDVTGVVNIIEKFNVWEHRFIVEECIDGMDLQKWLAREYPFTINHSLLLYEKKIHSIIKQLKLIVANIHDKGISIGDLQPANIMIAEDLTVTLIDFETADLIDQDASIGMATTTFSNSDIKNNKSRDEYALYKVLRFCLLPTYSTKETDIYLENNHLSWINNNFSVDIIRELDADLPSDKNMEPLNYNEVRKKMKIGILSHIKEGPYLIDGDIRQFEEQFGHLNILSGGMGVVWSLILNQTPINQNIYEWVDKHLLNNIEQFNDDGLFTGKSGIAVVLFELGYKDHALDVFESINISRIDKIDLQSGLSGVGLALLSLYEATSNERYLKKALTIADKILSIFENSDVKIASSGIIEGWTGPSVYFTTLYKYTKDSKYLSNSKSFIEADLVNTEIVDNTLQIKDSRDRYLPYLSEGSIGIGLAIHYLNKYKKYEDDFKEELNYIVNLVTTRITLNGGLFEGGAGFMLLAPLLKTQAKKVVFQENIHSLMKVFLIENDQHIVFPGQLSLRLSFDFFSGSAGVLAAVKSIQEDSPLAWIPTIDSINLFTLKGGE